MAKSKQTLTVIGSTRLAPAPDPPANVGPAGAALWAAIMRQYCIEDAGSIALLTQCCLAADRAESMRQAIDRDGEFVEGRNGLKAHPGLREELAARAFICRTLGKLGLNCEPSRGMGRPGGEAAGVTWAYR